MATAAHTHTASCRTVERLRLDLTPREQSRYSLSRAILAAASEAEGERNSHCFELELSQEIANNLPPGTKRRGGFFVPWNLAINPELVRRAEARTRAGANLRVRAGLDTKTTNQGKELVFTEAGEFVEYLYSQMVVAALGAQTLDNLANNVAFVKQTGKVTGSWVAENPGADVDDSNLTLAQITMSPKTYETTTSYSRQLLAQGAIDVDAMVRADLATDAALALDAAALIGTGSGANQPTGILNTSGVQQYTLAGDTGAGAVPTYADLSAIRELVETANANTLQNFGWATTPPIKSLLKKTARATGIALPIWTDDDLVDGFPARVTNQVPKNLTKSSGSNLSALLFGPWNTVVLGLWGSGFELVVDPYRLKKQGIVEVTSFLLCDVAVRQPTGFAVAKYCARS